MKKYGSKREIYQDYDLAIKLITDRSVNRRYYDRVLDTFRRDDRAKVLELQERVKGWDWGDSVGFFVEVPAYGDAQDVIGTQFILLEHETGPEFFIHVINPQFIHDLLLIAISYVGPKAFDAFYAQIQEVAFKKIGEKAEDLRRTLPSRTTISAVEIRTEHKGVGRLKFSEFEIDQIKCLLGGFKVHPGRNLFDFNQQCFHGALVEPPWLNR
jgi:hypothetical protein